MKQIEWAHCQQVSHSEQRPTNNRVIVYFLLNAFGLRLIVTGTFLWRPRIPIIRRTRFIEASYDL